MDLGALALFVPAAALIVTPGPDTLYVLCVASRPIGESASAPRWA